MSFLIGNQDKFLTNSSVHSINTRNKHQLHRPIANLSCFQKGAPYSGIRIFNNLPQNITSLRNEKPQFKVALKCSNLYSETTLLQPNRTNTTVHTETEQYTYRQSPTLEDECNSIRNMLSNKKLS